MTKDNQTPSPYVSNCLWAIKDKRQQAIRLIDKMIDGEILQEDLLKVKDLLDSIDNDLALADAFIKGVRWGADLE